MCCSNTSKSLSRLGILWGMCALATLLTAFVSNVWVYTKEPVKLPNADVTTSISFRIGLWRVCPSVKRVNSTIHVPSPACSLIKYSGWEEIKYSDLGVWTSLEFTPSFISRMRASTPFEATSVILVLLGTVFAMVGHCNSDRKTLVACGLFILGGLSLGSGLVIFASVLSEAYMERPQMVSRMTGAHSAYLTASGSKLNDALTPPYDYKYGWSFFAAGAAFIMAELAALLSITAYLRRFPTVEDMVRVMVPGAERKLREHHQHLSSDYLVRHVEGSNSRGGSSHHLHHHSTLPAQHCTSNSTQTKYPLSTTTQNYHTMRTQYDIIHHNTSSNTGGGGGGASNVPLLHHHTNTNICTVNNRKCDNPYSHHHHHHHQKDLLLDHTSHDESGGGGGGPRSNNDMIGCDGPLLLLNKTTPDLCSTSDQANNDYSSNEQVTDSLHVTSSAVIPGLNEQDFGPSLPPPNTTTLTSTPNNYLFAGQTVPIKIKKGSTQSFAGDHHNRYGTLPLSGSTIMHQGILGVCQVSGDSSSSTSSSYCSKSKTLHHKNKKSTIGNTTFSTMDCSSFEQFETSTLQKQQRTNTIGGPGGGGGTGSYNPTSSSAV